MKRQVPGTSLLVAMLFVQLGACSSTPEVSVVDQAIEDYVLVGELEEVKSIRTRDRDSYVRLTEHYVIYANRDGESLFYFSRPCRELSDPTRVTPDSRRDNRIRSGFDTLRGCRIDAIYLMTEAQAEEIRTMADAR